MFPVASSIYYRMPASVVDTLPQYDTSAMSLQAVAAERRKMAPMPALSLAVGRFPVDYRTPQPCYQTTSTPSPGCEQPDVLRWTNATPESVGGSASRQANAALSTVADDMTSSPLNATSSSPSSSSSPLQPDDVIKPILNFGVRAILSPNFASRDRTSTTCHNIDHFMFFLNIKYFIYYSIPILC